MSVLSKEKGTILSTDRTSVGHPLRTNYAESSSAKYRFTDINIPHDPVLDKWFKDE